MPDKEKVIEMLLDIIERLMALLRETNERERAEAIYREFFGDRSEVTG